MRKMHPGSTSDNGRRITTDTSVRQHRLKYIVEKYAFSLTYSDPDLRFRYWNGGVTYERR
jgi:hypothetical protein